MENKNNQFFKLMIKSMNCFETKRIYIECEEPQHIFLSMTPSIGSKREIIKLSDYYKFCNEQDAFKTEGGFISIGNHNLYDILVYEVNKKYIIQFIYRYDSSSCCTVDFTTYHQYNHKIYMFYGIQTHNKTEKGIILYYNKNGENIAEFCGEFDSHTKTYYKKFKIIKS